MNILKRVVSLAWASIGGWLLYYGVVEWKHLIATHLTGQAANIEFNTSNLYGLSLIYIQYFPHQLWVLLAMTVLPLVLFVIPGVYWSLRK